MAQCIGKEHHLRNVPPPGGCAPMPTLAKSWRVSNG
jgi:hypothetical protein